MNKDRDLEEYKKGYYKRTEIYNQIEKERLSQDSVWGAQNHNLVEWMAILMEEVGEASQVAVDYHFCNPVKYKEFGDTMRREAQIADQDNRLSEYRKELIQVAALAVQMLESLDRNELSKK